MLKCAYYLTIMSGKRDSSLCVLARFRYFQVFTRHVKLCSENIAICSARNRVLYNVLIIYRVLYSIKNSHGLFVQSVLLNDRYVIVGNVSRYRYDFGSPGSIGGTVFLPLLRVGRQNRHNGGCPALQGQFTSTCQLRILSFPSVHLFSKHSYHFKTIHQDVQPFTGSCYSNKDNEIIIRMW